MPTAVRVMPSQVIAKQARVAVTNQLCCYSQTLRGKSHYHQPLSAKPCLQRTLPAHHLSMSAQPSLQLTLPAHHLSMSAQPSLQLKLPAHHPSMSAQPSLQLTLPSHPG